MKAESEIKKPIPLLDVMHIRMNMSTEPIDAAISKVDLFIADSIGAWG